MDVTVSKKSTQRVARGGTNSLPPQNVAQSVKMSDKWQRSCMDSIISMASYQSTNGRSNRKNKVINYDMMNSRFKEADFKHILNPYNVQDARYTGSQTKLQMYNIVRTKIEALKGEEMKLGMNFRAVAVNGDAVLEKNKERQEAIRESIKATAMAMVNNDLDPETGKPNAENPDEVANKFKTEYAHPTEIAVNQLLNFLAKQDKLQMKFSKGWEHALIVAEEIYYAHIKNGHPSLRVVNPLNVEFDRESDNPFIHEADWVREERMMPIGAVIDAYGDSLSKKEINLLDSGVLGGKSHMTNGMEPGFAYNPNGGMRMDGGLAENQDHVYVANCAWKSMRRIGNLKYFNERTGSIEETIVDESYKLTPEMKATGAVVDWTTITDIWTGTRIAEDIYINVQSMDNQTGKLPFVGYVYNNLNSNATSIVDMCKAHQYTYIIVWYRLEQELAKAKGKKFIMDLAQLPKSKGWTTDQWMYYFDNMGVAWINSMEEGRKNDKSTISTFNQFQAIDMSLSQIVGQYMEILNKLEEQIETTTGVNKQREGDIGRNETATGATRAIVQSTNNTRPLFFYHDMVRQEALQQLMELCKVAYIDGAEIEYVVDKETVESIKIDAGMLNTTDLGVFMTNTFDEAQDIEKLEGYLGLAMQSNVASLSDIVSVLGSKSMSEIKSTIVAADRERIAREEKNNEANRESQEKISAETAAVQREVMAEARYGKELDNLTKKEVALIQAEDEGETDADKNLKDVKAQVEQDKIKLLKEKQEMDDKNKKKELKIKEKELTIKKSDSATKNK